VTCDRLVIFSGFLHQKNWPSRYNWYIVESDIKHHQTNRIGKDKITSEKKNTCLEETDLLRFSGAIYPSCLLQVAPILKIDKVQVDAIKCDNPHSTCYKTVKKEQMNLQLVPGIFNDFWI
jgi:hypothetical protein